MINVVTVLAFFMIFVFLGSSIRIGNRQFTSFLSFIILVVSIYAVFKTSFFSFYFIYLISFLTWYLIQKINKRFTFEFKLKIEDNFVALIIWGLFSLVYLDFENFYILHPGNSLDDISVYSRIAFYNDVLGVENTMGVYNLYSNSHKLELYHHFELWMTNFGHFFTRTNRSMNLLLFVFPMISFLSYLGIKEFFVFNQWYSLVFLFLFFVIIWPYDIIVDLLGLGLPKGGGGLILLDIKNVMILPILISVVYEIRTKNSYFYLTAISLFLYPLLIPLISASVISFILFFYKRPFKYLWAHLVLILLFFIGTLFIPNSHPGFDLFGFFNFSVLPKILFVSIITLLISFGFYWVCFLRKVGMVNIKGLLLFFLISLILSIMFWLVFNKNIDSNQLFRNLFVPLGSFSIAGSILFFYKKNYTFTP